MFKTAVLTLSDRCAAGEREDESGKILLKMLSEIGGEIIEYNIIPDDKALIMEKLIFYCDVLKIDLIVTTGGTGLGPRDVTPEATTEISDRIIPGISEFIRMEGLKKTSRAMLSRGICAMRGNSIIINLPGSPKGARESLEPVIDIIPHAISMVNGGDHHT